MSQSNTKQEPRSFLDRYAKILVVVAVLCGATSGNFGALISAPASVTGFWRLLIALPFFAVPIFAKEESRKKLFAVSKRTCFWPSCRALFCLDTFLPGIRQLRAPMWPARRYWRRFIR